MITFFVINAILLLVSLILLLAEKFLVTYGECSININGDRSLEVSGGDNLLNYLNQEKLFIPSACGGKATCGFCKVKVLSGGRNILPTEEVFITKLERAEGLRLACQVKVMENLDIFIPEHLLNAEEFSSKVEEIKDLTHDIKLVRLKLLNNKNMKFRPGQYIQFKIPGTDEFRAYSIASSPKSSDAVELIIRLVAGGLCSTYIHKALDKGDEVVFTGSFGDFYLQEESQKDIIAIAGGCGMAPMRSIIYHEVQKKMPRKFLYFFGARSKKDLFFTDELKALEKKYPNFKYFPALSEPSPKDHWEGEVGLVTQVVEKHIDEKRQKEAYLCGPPPMIDAAMRVLSKKGIASEDVYYDKF